MQCPEALLFIEDAGLLEGVLALGYIPHPDCPIIATGGQQAFFTAPTAGDDLIQTEKHWFSNKNTGATQTII